MSTWTHEEEARSSLNTPTTTATWARASLGLADYHSARLYTLDTELRQGVQPEGHTQGYNNVWHAAVVFQRSLRGTPEGLDVYRAPFLEEMTWPPGIIIIIIILTYLLTAANLHAVFERSLGDGYGGLETTLI